jgi:hypothetical protein
MLDLVHHDPYPQRMLQLKNTPWFSRNNLGMTHPHHQQGGQHPNAHGCLRRPRIKWQNFRSLILLRLLEVSSGDKTPPKVVEQQEIKAQAALHIQGLLGYHYIRWHGEIFTAPPSEGPCYRAGSHSVSRRYSYLSNHTVSNRTTS